MYIYKTILLIALKRGRKREGGRESTIICTPATYTYIQYIRTYIYMSCGLMYGAHGFGSSYYNIITCLISVLQGDKLVDK